MNQDKHSVITGNAIIGQSGGPTAVINQSLVGVIETLRHQQGIEKIFGSLHGVRGIINDQFIDLKNIPQQRLERIAQTPSAALGSTRDKPDEKYCEQIFHHFEKNNIRYFFYIGGNDSSDTCRIVNDLSNHAGYELRCFHVPKTIDNDLMHNDHTPGYASAARFVAQSFIGDDLDNRSMPGIKINVIMGRHAGFLTAASVMARRNENDGPHLIYVPEVSFVLENFLLDVEKVYKKLGRCLIAISEGVHTLGHGPIVAQLAKKAQGNVEKDAHNNVQLSGTGALGDYLCQAIRQHLGDKTRVRADTFGYLQRCFAGCTSTTDAHEARMVGRKAAEAAMKGHIEGSIAIGRASEKPYTADYHLIDLKTVAGKTRCLDPQFIIGDNNIAENFKNYLDPLIGPLPSVELLRISHPDY